MGKYDVKCCIFEASCCRSCIIRHRLWNITKTGLEFHNLLKIGGFCLYLSMYVQLHQVIHFYRCHKRVLLTEKVVKLMGPVLWCFINDAWLYKNDSRKPQLCSIKGLAELGGYLYIYGIAKLSSPAELLFVQVLCASFSVRKFKSISYCVRLLSKNLAYSGMQAARIKFCLCFSCSAWNTIRKHLWALVQRIANRQNRTQTDRLFIHYKYFFITINYENFFTTSQ